MIRAASSSGRDGPTLPQSPVGINTPLRISGEPARWCGSPPRCAQFRLAGGEHLPEPELERAGALLAGGGGPGRGEARIWGQAKSCQALEAERIGRKQSSDWRLCPRHPPRRSVCAESREVLCWPFFMVFFFFFFSWYHLYESQKPSPILLPPRWWWCGRGLLSSPGYL